MVYDSATGRLVGQNVTTPIIAAGAITSSLMASGAIGGPLIGDYGVASGKIASGSVTETQLISGISIDIAETTQDPSFRTAELVSAYMPVRFMQSGAYGLARAHSGARPAIGLMAGANAASGALATILTLGRVVNTGWNFSGSIGNPIFLGTSANLVTSAPAGSGEYVQRLGEVISERSVMLMSYPFDTQLGS